MLQCWQENPDDRPTFSSLKDTLTKMIQNNDVCFICYLIFSFLWTPKLSEKFLPRSGFPGFTLPAARSGLDVDRSDILLKDFHQGGFKAGLTGSYTLKYTFSPKKNIF